MNYLILLKNEINQLESESSSKIKASNMNYLNMLKQTIEEIEPAEESPAEETPAEETPVEESPVAETPAHPVVHVKPLIDNDLRKLLLVLSAVDLSASFLQTNSSNGTDEAESYKASLSAAKLAKVLSEDLNLGSLPLSVISNAKDTVDAAIVAAQTYISRLAPAPEPVHVVEEKSSSNDNEKIHSDNGDEVLLCIQEIKKKQHQQHQEAAAASAAALSGICQITP